jgi:uncharacterized protein
MANMINWFEIPVKDMNRASEFYSKLIEAPIHQMEMGGRKMGMLPDVERGEVSGALVEDAAHVPTMHGSLLYLNAKADLAPWLERVEKLGGKVIMPKTHINDEIGYMATFTDSEGNKVALHSQG